MKSCFQLLTGVFIVFCPLASTSFFPLYDPRYDNPEDGNHLFKSYDGCDSSQRWLLDLAFQNAKDMVQGVLNTDFANDPAAIDFFGLGNVDDHFFNNTRITPYPKVTFEKVSETKWDLDAICGPEAPNISTKCGDPNIYGEIHSTMISEQKGVLLFCDKFFHMAPLFYAAESVTASRNHEDFRRRFDLSAYHQNQGMCLTLFYTLVVLLTNL